MNFDLGCNNQIPLINRISVAAFGAGVILLVFTGLAALGACVRRGGSFRATDIIVGWACVAVVMTVAVVSSHAALEWTSAGLGILMLIALGVGLRRGYFRSPFWFLLLFPGGVISAALIYLGISGWDDFSHWIPNALYLYEFNGVPGHDMPAPHSAWPSYPYAIPSFTYLASHVADGFLLQGGAAFNFLLLLSFAAFLADMGVSHSYHQRRTEVRPIAWLGRASLALVLITLANPSFNASFTMTNQGDTSTMVLVGVIAVLLWRLIEALQAKDGDRISDLLFQVALAASVFVLVKQVALIILALLTVGFLFVAFRNGIGRLAAIRLPLMVGPAICLYLLWRHYVDVAMNGMGFEAKPLALWHFDLAGAILHGMVREASKKGGLFALIGVVIGAGGFSLLRPPTRLGNFALMSAIVSAGYLVFLFLTYLGSNFSEAEIRRAASFYRYSTHVGLLGIVYLWLWLPIAVLELRDAGRLPPVIRTVLEPTPHVKTAFVAFLVCLLPLALTIHSGWLIRGTNPELCAFRNVGQRVARALPDGTRLGVLDAQTNGYFGYVINLELALHEYQATGSSSVKADIGLSEQEIEAKAKTFPADGDVQALLIHRATQDSLLLSRSGQWWPVPF